MITRSPYTLRILLLCLLFAVAGCKCTEEKISQWQQEGQIEKLVKALEDPQPAIRCQAAKALFSLKNEAAAEHIGPLLEDDDPAVQACAKETLLAMNHPVTIPFLCGILQQTPPPQEVIVALGELQNKAAVSPLLPLLDDPSEDIRCAIISALEKIGDPLATSALIDHLGSDSTRQNLAIVRALPKTGGLRAAHGLASALSDTNANVRFAAVAALAQMDHRALSAVEPELKSSNPQVRQAAALVYKRANAVPKWGERAIWYELALATSGKSQAIDKNKVYRIADLATSSFTTLLEAAGHKDLRIARYANLALEHSGPAGAEKAVAVVESEISNDHALLWYKNRASWCGAPSWELDLWGAITVLSDAFTYNRATLSHLEGMGENAYRIMRSRTFEPLPAYIPSLVKLLGDSRVSYTNGKKFSGIENQKLARKWLAEAGTEALMPLIAALNSNQQQIRNQAAAALSELYDSRAIQPLMRALSKEIAQNKTDNSAAYEALQRFNVSYAEPLLRRVRPTPARAQRIFEQHYPDIKVYAVQDRSTKASSSTSFRLFYTESNGRTHETTLNFRRSSNGSWTPFPALPKTPPRR